MKADEDSEAGILPSKERVVAMGKYNDELVKSGVLLAGEGLLASSKGARFPHHRGSSFDAHRVCPDRKVYLTHGFAAARLHTRRGPAECGLGRPIRCGSASAWWPALLISWPRNWS
ncbi:MAG: hypothetical protein ACRDTH_25235 [Pseudonocardiaceae bacterium]